MSLGLSLGRPSDDAIAAFVAEQARLEPSYAYIGATRDRIEPPGFHVDHWSAPLGSGDAVFARAKEGIRQWAAHHGAGVHIQPANAEVRIGQTVALLVRTGGLYMLASCRVVWIVDEENAFGFGYGTMPGHPECGEESFVINRVGDDVTFDINAISRARHPLAKLGGPVTRALQIQATKRYLSAMQTWVGDHSASQS